MLLFGNSVFRRIAVFGSRTTMSRTRRKKKSIFVFWRISRTCIDFLFVCRYFDILKISGRTFSSPILITACLAIYRQNNLQYLVQYCRSLAGLSETLHGRDKETDNPNHNPNPSRRPSSTVASKCGSENGNVEATKTSVDSVRGDAALHTVQPSATV